MALEIRPVNSKKELKQFVKFRIDLYKNNPYAIPPLYMDEMGTLDPKKNPAFEFCEAQCFMAYKEEKIVGRIAAMINHRANEKWNEKNGRFGFIDFIDDEEVSSALLKTAEEWVKAKGMTHIHGPLGFTDLDQEGMLVEGYDQLGTMATIYNYPYYPVHLEKRGYRKDAEWLEHLITIPETLHEKLNRIADIVTKKFNLRVLKFSSTRQLIKEGYGKKFFELINVCYSPLYGSTPLSEKQIDYYIKMYISMLNLDFLTLVVDESDELIGLGVVMPSLSKALQKMQGKLFPFGFIYLLKDLKMKNPVIDLLLIGVRPDYQNKGVNSIIMNDIHVNCRKHGVKYAESNPMLADNDKALAQWEYFESKVHKRRWAFIREL
ncbi:N-acetyltransferase [Parabacteroides sp. FAFU027]|uniref:N-acetyltransferase n=1 Tax=Parabacteroides sp. FAFU027 TaxID=2922715 RepID=UPI001FAFCC4D|nr:N-acetyltransferase [Parabacteroides sp. FAFU027]